ncbi:MAG: SOS response-associated peptidase [Candidatus Obscuribacterales bacterium]|nr:SOS response-associated peptidase [Candidatus Obscuribacterales bacterium]
MCGRYTLIHPTTDILQRFGLTQIKIEGLPVEIEPRANIAPSQLVPAVVNHGFGKEQFRMLDALRWGFLPMWVKDIKKSPPMINARAETLAEKAYFKGALRSRRCIIPADSFYEWDGQGKARRPYRFQFKDQRLFGLAGLYEEWSSPTGGDIVTCCIVTVAANRLLSRFHDRMPAILDPEDEARWLDSDVDSFEAQLMLKSHDPYDMDCYPVSPELNKATASGLHLVDFYDEAEAQADMQAKMPTKNRGQKSDENPDQLKLF